ncbi:hypothetical protein, conserved [Eimeria necatrix]|uniref:Uncharacterized protein n=1 Tax=Eimeria necatrix TaxID=51315 RepID=U6MTY2_9EIME|nr:hypothetical protein, conserved [Eimeria necatrix]CDJ65934.1 hypothetical protein, conserved [Eimeria necatrix]
MSRFMLFGALLAAFEPFSAVESAQYGADFAAADADTVLRELPSVQVSDARLRGKAAADLTRALLGLSLVTALMAVVFLVLHCYKTLRLNSNLGTAVRRLAEDDEPQCSVSTGFTPAMPNVYRSR